MPLARNHLRVRRSDGREFPTMVAAYRALLGTNEEITSGFRRSTRAQLRAGAAAVRDVYGFSWTLVSGATFPAISWTDLTFGVELELVMPAGMDRLALRSALWSAGIGDWAVKSDGSIQGNGAEVVSPVLKGTEGLEKVEKVTRILQEVGCDVNVSCGMHVHVGVGSYLPNQIANVAASFVANEMNFDSIVARSRRANNSRYAQTVSGRRIGDNVTTISTLAHQLNGGFSTVHYNQYRYYKLNIQSYALHRTIEFRQHQGTVEGSKVCAWVRLLTGFVAQTLNGRIDTLGFDEFAALSGDRAEFLKSRRAHFAR